MSDVHELNWSDVAGHPVVVCPNCKGKSESGSENMESLKVRGICANCYKKQSVIISSQISG